MYKLLTDFGVTSAGFLFTEELTSNAADLIMKDSDWISLVALFSSDANDVWVKGLSSSSSTGYECICR